MIAPFPPDRALPGLWALLDEPTMATLIENRLSASSEGSIRIRSCRPRYVRYKPGTSCLRQYDLTLWHGDGQPRTMSAHIKLFEYDRAAHQASGQRMARLRERVERLEPGLARDAYLPEINGLLQLFPVDYDLRYLSRAANQKTMTGVFRKQLKADRTLAVTGEPEAIRYKPERKALLRYELENAPVVVLYGRIHSAERVGSVPANTQHLIEAGVRTPPALVTIPKHNFVAHAGFPGVQLAGMRGSEAYEAWMSPLAASLRHFQSVDIPSLKDHRLADEASLIRRTSDWLAEIAPHFSARLRRIGDEIATRFLNMDDQQRTGHGDFYDDQALVSDGGLTIIDLDELRRAHPLLDAGNMLAHLTSGEDLGEDVGAAREAFLAETLRHMPYTGADLAVFEASALLRLAPGPFRRLEPDWPDGIDRILSLVERRLENASRAMSPPPQSSPSADPSLPQLTTLQDPAAMTARFVNGHSDEGGIPLCGDVQQSLNGTHPAPQPAFVQHVEVVRHKLGRRAILRYDLATGGSLFGKTFASGRGAKVYETARTIAAARAFGPDIALPDPVAWLPDLRLLLQKPVRGAPVEQSLLDGEKGLAAAIACVLPRFHGSGLDLGRTHDLAKELEPLPMRAAQVAEACPELGEVANTCLDRIQAIEASQFDWRLQPVHRDFYHDQVLCDRDRLAILDLDDAAMSEPLVDVANFRAHLVLLGAQRSGDATALAVVSDDFVEQYRCLDPAFDERLLQFLTATTLLRLSGIHVSRKDGPAVARLLIEAANRTLDPVPRPFNAAA
ncbi:hypothetical protein BH20CHL3_BH20CHL3_05770 [soil metagenome]